MAGAVRSWHTSCLRPPHQAAAGGSAGPSCSTELQSDPETGQNPRVRVRAGGQGGFSSNLLFPQDALDALALVGTEGDAGFSGAGALFHLLLLVFLLHLHLEITCKKKKEPSQCWCCLLK